MKYIWKKVKAACKIGLIPEKQNAKLNKNEKIYQKFIKNYQAKLNSMVKSGEFQSKLQTLVHCKS